VVSDDPYRLTDRCTPAIPVAPATPPCSYGRHSVAEDVAHLSHLSGLLAALISCLVSCIEAFRQFQWLLPLCHAIVAASVVSKRLTAHCSSIDWLGAIIDPLFAVLVAPEHLASSCCCCNAIDWLVMAIVDHFPAAPEHLAPSCHSIVGGGGGDTLTPAVRGQ
jgi:hypothetical protein